MKRSSSVVASFGLLTLASLLFFTRGGFGDTDTNTFVNTVTILERMGRYDEAEARCLQVLQQNPSDAEAKRLLTEIQSLRHKPGPSTSLRELLETIIIPEVNFREAGVADVIEFLKTESQKISGAQNPINFVWEAPESFKTAKITLSLRQVPLADALKYVTGISGLRYRVDPHAVVINEAPPPAPSDHFPLPSNVKSP
jgi:hypothetical protein